MTPQNNETPQPKPIILNFKKRRFDGAHEMDALTLVYTNRKVILSQVPTEQETSHRLEQGQCQRAPQSKKSQRILQALITGPLEVAVGSVGILTAGIAIFTFSWCNNTALVNHSKNVFSDCVKTMGQGLVNTVIGPGKALKVLVMGT